MPLPTEFCGARRADDCESLRVDQMIEGRSRLNCGESLRERVLLSLRLLRLLESYGAETVAPSPAAEIVNVPRAALMAKLYAAPHAVLGGVGIAAMNGPAVMFCAFVAMAVSRLRALGNTPMCADQAATAEAIPRMSAWAFATRARACMLA